MLFSAFYHGKRLTLEKTHADFPGFAVPSFWISTKVPHSLIQIIPRDLSRVLHFWQLLLSHLSPWFRLAAHWWVINQKAFIQTTLCNTQGKPLYLTHSLLFPMYSASHLQWVGFYLQLQFVCSQLKQGHCNSCTVEIPHNTKSRNRTKGFAQKKLQSQETT